MKAEKDFTHKVEGPARVRREHNYAVRYTTTKIERCLKRGGWPGELSPSC